MESWMPEPYPCPAKNPSFLRARIWISGKIIRILASLSLLYNDLEKIWTFSSGYGWLRLTIFSFIVSYLNSSYFFYLMTNFLPVQFFWPFITNLLNIFLGFGTLNFFQVYWNNEISFNRFHYWIVIRSASWHYFNIWSL